MNKVTKEELELLYLKQKLPMHKVAKLLNISIGSVYNYIHQYDIPARNKAETFTTKGLKVPNEAKLKISQANKGKVRSLETKNKISKSKFGIRKNNYWNGHIKIRGDGYVSVYKPEHPNASIDGYIMEHRLVMEQILGRILDPCEVVHHVNGNRKDNRPQNLMIFNSLRDHQKYHQYFRKEVKINECK